MFPTYKQKINVFLSKLATLDVFFLKNAEYLSSLIALFLLPHSRFKFNYFTQILTAIIFLFGHFNILLF